MEQVPNRVLPRNSGCLSDAVILNGFPKVSAVIGKLLG